MRIGIVGSGTAGAASALFLRRAGHEVEIFERVAHPSPVGAGVLLQPTGQAVLRRLGLLDRVAGIAHPVARLHGLLPSGRVLMRLAYEEIGPGLTAYGLHRGSFFEVTCAALEEAGIPLHTGADVTAVSPEGRLDIAGREGAGPFDLVIVADGARSHLRAQVSPVRRDRAYAWGALWFVGQAWKRDEEDELFQVFGGTERLIGLLPTGKDPSGRKVVSLFWGVELGAMDALRASGLEAWKSSVRKLTSKADPILDQITDIDQLIVAGYRDAVVRSPWRARTVLVGDAAHAMSPQLGQGVNLALCDAAALADALATHPTLDRALPAYAALRRDHIAFYQVASRWLTPLFQSRIVGLGTLRDIAVPLFNRVPFLRRQSILSMAGLKDGVLSSWLDRHLLEADVQRGSMTRPTKRSAPEAS